MIHSSSMYAQHGTRNDCKCWKKARHVANVWLNVTLRWAGAVLFRRIQVL